MGCMQAQVGCFGEGILSDKKDNFNGDDFDDVEEDE